MIDAADLRRIEMLLERIIIELSNIRDAVTPDRRRTIRVECGICKQPWTAGHSCVGVITTTGGRP